VIPVNVTWADSVSSVAAAVWVCAICWLPGKVRIAALLCRMIMVRATVRTIAPTNSAFLLIYELKTEPQEKFLFPDNLVSILKQRTVWTSDPTPLARRISDRRSRRVRCGLDRSSGRRVPSNRPSSQASPRSAPMAAMLPPSFRTLPGPKGAHRPPRCWRLRDDASLRPVRWHDDRSTRPM